MSLSLQEIDETTISSSAGFSLDPIKSETKKERISSEQAMDILEVTNLESIQNSENGVEFSLEEIETDLINKEEAALNNVDIKNTNTNLFQQEYNKTIISGQEATLGAINSGDSGLALEALDGTINFSKAAERGFDTFYNDLNLSVESNEIREELKKFNTDLESWEAGLEPETESNLSTLDKIKWYGSNTISFAGDLVSGRVLTQAGYDFVNGVVGAYRDLVAEPTLKLLLGDKISRKTIAERINLPEIPVSWETTTTEGKISADLLRIFGSVATIGSKLDSITKAGKIGSYAIAGLVTDLTQFDPYDAKLADLINEHTGFGNLITEALATDLNNPASIERLKNGAEGLLIGLSFDAFLAGVRGLKNLKALKNEVGRAATALKLKSILGDKKTFAIYRADVDSLAKLFKNLNLTDEAAIKKLESIVNKGTDPLSEKIRIALSQAESSDIVVPVVDSIESSAARAAVVAADSGDEAAISNLTRGVETLLVPGDSKMKKIVEDAFQIGDVKLHAITPLEDTPILKDSFSAFEVQFNNALKVQSAVADDIFFGSVIARQKTVDDIIQTRVYKSKIDWGQLSNEAWEDAPAYKSLWNHAVKPPASAFRGDASQELVKDATNAFFQSTRVKNAFNDAERAIFKGLGGKKRNLLNHVIASADDIEETFHVVEGGLLSESGKHFIPATPDVVDAYYAVRRLDDAAFNMANETARKIAKKRGYKVFNNEFLVRQEKPVVGTTYTDSAGKEFIYNTDSMKKGDIALAFHGDDLIPTILRQEEVGIRLTDIDDSFKVLRNKKNHMPRIYKDDYFIVKVSKDGGLKTTHTAKTAVKAGKLIKELKEADKASEYIFIRRGEFTNVGADTSFVNFLRNAREEEVAALRNSMKLAGIDEKKIEEFIGANHKRSFISNRHFQKRGERLQTTPYTTVDPITGKKSVTTDAPLHYADEAFSKYFASISEFIEVGELKAAVQDKFVKNFSDVLSNPSDWNSTIKYQSGKYNKAFNASLYQGQIRRIARVPTVLEQKLKAVDNELLHRLVDGGTKNIYINAYEKLPSIYGMARFAKGVTAITGLYAFSIAQFALQLSQMIGTIGVNMGRVINPNYSKAVLRANKNFMNVVLPTTVKGATFTKTGKLLRDELTKSGFIADIDFEPLRQVFFELDNMDDLSRGSRSVVRGLAELSGKPFKTGEALQRTYAWFSEREMLIEEISRGKSLKFTPKDINTDAFRMEVNNRAGIIAHNMTRMNQPTIARGLLGLPFQFQQVVLHQISLLLNMEGKLTGPELAGLWLTYAAILGPNAVPMIDTAIDLTEKAAGNFWPEAVGALSLYTPAEIEKFAEDKFGAGEIVRNYIKGGGIGVITDGRYNFSARVGMTSMFSAFYDNSTIPELLGGPPLRVFKSYITGGHRELKDFRDIILQEGINKDTLEQMGEATAYNLAEIYPSAKNFVAATVRDDGTLRSHKGSIIEEDPNSIDQLAILFGFLPQGLETDKKYKYKMLEAKKAYREWIKKKAQSLATDAVNKPELFDARFKEVTNKLREMGVPQLIPSFITLTMTMRMNNDLTVSEQNELNVIADMVVESGWSKIYKK